MRLRRSIAAAGVAVLALSACTGDGGDGGGDGVSADAPPAEVVAAGLDERFENGAAFRLRVEGDLEELAAESGEEVPPEVVRLMEEGLVSGAASPDGGFAMTIGADGGFLEMRAVEEALYLRLDLEQVASTFPDAGDIPPPDVLRGQLEAFPLSPDVAAVAEAALDGRWIGITGLSQEALQDFAESMGGQVPSDEDMEAQQEAMREQLEERGLLDGTTFTERYLVVEGDGPTYQLTVMARDLVTTLNEIATEAQASLGPAAGPSQDLPDTEDVPEQLSGFSVTVEDGVATAIAGDIAMIGESAGEDTGDLEAGDAVFVLDLSDLGDELSIPGDATTIDFETLVSGVMGAMLGGGMGGDLSG